MSDRQESLKPSGAANETGEKLAGRRRFLKNGALVATPVIISVASKPVWAGNCSLSGMLSGNLSQQQYQCQGGTPGFWGTHPRVWPFPYDPGVSSLAPKKRGATGNNGVYTGGTLFYNTFSTARRIVVYNNVSMMNVIQMSGTDDRYQLGAHAVCALLNATFYYNKYGTAEVFGYSADQIKAMWANLTIGDEELKVMFATLNERSPNPLS